LLDYFAILSPLIFLYTAVKSVNNLAYFYLIIHFSLNVHMFAFSFETSYPRINIVKFHCYKLCNSFFEKSCIRLYQKMLFKKLTDVVKSCYHFILTCVHYFGTRDVQRKNCVRTFQSSNKVSDQWRIYAKWCPWQNLNARPF